MKTKSWALVAPLLATFTGHFSLAHAQESLAGIGAASGMGATLGAAVSGSGAQARRSAQGVGAPGIPGGELDGAPPQGGNPAFPGGSVTTTTTQTRVTRISTPLAGRPGTGGAILGQLLAPRRFPNPTRTRRSARAQAAYSRRVSRLSPTARKKLVLGKYRIAPRGYLASYLPADRYKFAKAWKFVSTETDTFYYRPQDLARRRFNPNRVIGFRTWQDAMLAGYRPDPVSRPEPGNQLAYLATLTRDEPLTQYIEYIYSGQVSPSSVTSTTNYIRRVKSVIDRNPRARPYQRQTINSILLASLTGDASLIPRQLGAPPAPVAPAGFGADGLGGGGFGGGGLGAEGLGGGMMGGPGMRGNPNFPSAGAGGAVSGKAGFGGLSSAEGR